MTERERIERAERPKREAALADLRIHANVLAREFDLPLRSVDAERANVKRRYGVCYEDGSIRIRLFHVRTRRLLAYSSMIDTLCHELAHLRHFDHGKRFEALYERIRERARALGIYRPGTRRRPANEQSEPRYAVRPGSFGQTGPWSQKSPWKQTLAFPGLQYRLYEKGAPASARLEPGRAKVGAEGGRDRENRGERASADGVRAAVQLRLF